MVPPSPAIRPIGDARIAARLALRAAGGETALPRLLCADAGPPISAALLPRLTAVLPGIPTLLPCVVLILRI
jgi:hypothetical protein